MRRGLILTSQALLILTMLVMPILSARYVLSGASIFQVATLLNQVGRPLVGIMVAIVLFARFRDVWTRRTDVNESASRAMARFAQTTGVVLMFIFFVLLVLVLIMQFAIPAGERVELPIFFIFGPLLATLPVGYIMFELGRLLEKDGNR